MMLNQLLVADDHRTCQTLTGITLQHMPDVGALGRLQHYGSSSDIWRPEDESDRVFFVKRGHVTVLFADAQGHEIVLRQVEADQPLGELCFCAPEHRLRETFARAQVESDVVVIKHSDFVNYLQSNSAALQALLFTFCTRLGEAERRAEILAYRGAEERLGRLLLQLGEARGHPHKATPGPVTLHIGHEELARTAAMSRAHVTVTMGKLREQGLISYERNRPLIVNLPQLEAYLNKRVA